MTVSHLASESSHPLSKAKELYYRGAWVAQWVKPLPSAQVMISGSWDQAPNQALCSTGSLPPPLSACLSAYL